MKLKMLLIAILVIPLVIGADFTFEQNKEFDLKFFCFNETNSLCPSGSTCNMTLFYPNNTILVNNQQLTFNPSYFNYTLNSTQTTATGIGIGSTYCYGTTVGFSTFNYEVTPTGEVMTSTQGFTSMGLILSVMFISFLFMFTGFKFSESSKLYPIALFFILVSLVLAVYTIQLGYIYSKDILFPLATENAQFKIWIGVIYGLIGMSFIALLFLILKTLREFRERKSLINYGQGFDTRTKMYK